MPTASASLVSSTRSKPIRCRGARSAGSPAGVSIRRCSRSGLNGKTNTRGSPRAGTRISAPLRSACDGFMRTTMNPAGQVSAGSATAVSRSQPSCSSLIDSIATAAPPALSSGSATYSDTHAR